MDNLAVTWASDVLKNLGHIVANYQTVRSMPWSEVTRLHCDDGVFYLKCPVAAFSHEGLVLKSIGEQAPFSVFKLIAYNGPGGALITADAGEPLRSLASTENFSGLMVQAVQQYAIMQKNMIPHIPALVENGVPEWTPKRLPELYGELLESNLLWKADGACKSDIMRFKNCLPMLTNACEMLDDIGIPNSIDQGDFQDNNIFIKNGLPRTGDFGEVVISHPFLSITRFRESMKRVHRSAGTSAITAAMDAYLAEWTVYANATMIQEAIKLAEYIHPIREALGLARLWRAVDGLGMERQSGLMTLSLNIFVKSKMPLSH